MAIVAQLVDATLCGAAIAAHILGLMYVRIGEVTVHTVESPTPVNDTAYWDVGPYSV